MRIILLLALLFVADCAGWKNTTIDLADSNFIQADKLEKIERERLLQTEEGKIYKQNYDKFCVNCPEFRPDFRNSWNLECELLYEDYMNSEQNLTTTEHFTTVYLPVLVDKITKEKIVSGLLRFYYEYQGVFIEAAISINNRYYMLYHPKEWSLINNAKVDDLLRTIIKEAMARED